MKNGVIKIVCSIVLITIVSCSVKKDTFVSRNFQTLTTKYNVLFNGEEAFKKGLQEIREKHQDNYWKRLPIEPITFDETQIAVPKFITVGTDGENTQENKNVTPFELAEEKAVKAIQKHSMNFGGIEKNRRIDDSYLLLGKARYYTQRFIPAIEALNYVINNYPDANLIYDTKIWLAKSNIRLENEGKAIESLELLLNSKKNSMPSQIKEKVHTVLAMAYEKTDKIEKVIEHLSKAIETQKDKEQTARNMFILGQIYSELNYKDSAKSTFQKLIDFKKAPYKYRIHANIELAKNSVGSASSEDLINRFKKLIKNRDNRPYLDKLYYQIGVLEEEQGNKERAIAYYQKSLKAENGEAQQKTYTYERLGSLNFNNSNFVLASAYYDSVLQVADESIKNEKRIRSIRRKHKALSELTKYELIVQTNDSVLKIASMPKEEQEAFFENYIEKLKKADEQLAEQQLNNAVSFGNAFSSNSSLQNVNSNGKWYFYSDQIKSFGEMEFQKIWGTRPLEDNWRWSNKTSIKTEQDAVSENKIDNQQRYNLETYLSKIPTEKSVIDSLQNETNNALYQLGLIYKEQFKNPALAIKNLERLKAVNTDENLNLPIYYHLYQVYLEENNPKAAEYKNLILSEYADSKYAQIIQFPNKKLEENSIDSVEETYKELYYLYKNNNFEAVVTKINAFLPNIQNSNFLPKFELLKAYSLGKYKDKETYKKAMEFVATNFSNTEEGIKAKQIVERLKLN